MKLTRLYAPHVKQGKRWIRVTEYTALPKDKAVHRYQSWLLAPYMNADPAIAAEVRELRPIKKGVIKMK